MYSMCSVGDHGLEGVGLCGGLQHQFTAQGEAEAADALRIDVRAAAEIVEGGLDVALAAPAVRVTLALADAASNTSTPYPWRASMRTLVCTTRSGAGCSYTPPNSSWPVRRVRPLDDPARDQLDRGPP